MALGGIRKPSFYAFALLHLLGNQRLENPSKDVLVTRRGDGTFVVGAWNLVDPDKKGSDRKIHLSFPGKTSELVIIHRVDEKHGNTRDLYHQMGQPHYPTPAQVKELNLRSQPGPAEKEKLVDGGITIDVPVNGLVLVELSPTRGVH